MHFRLLREKPDDITCAVTKVADLDFLGWGASEKKGMLKRFVKLEEALEYFFDEAYLLADVTDGYGARSEWTIRIKR